MKATQPEIWRKTKTTKVYTTWPSLACVFVPSRISAFPATSFRKDRRTFVQVHWLLRLHGYHPKPGERAILRNFCGIFRTHTRTLFGGFGLARRRAEDVINGTCGKEGEAQRFALKFWIIGEGERLESLEGERRTSWRSHLAILGLLMLQLGRFERLMFTRLPTIRS